MILKKYTKWKLLYKVMDSMPKTLTLVPEIQLS